MNSSLQNQLSFLRNKQSTSQAVSKGSCFSLLFSFKDASRFSREDILDLACLGLQELSSVDSQFDCFFDSLFNPLSKYFNRNSKTATELAETDNLINKFLFLASNHLLNQSLHKTLEFLIKVYEINQHNEQQLLLAFLPYHSSPVFIKLIQNIHVKHLEIFKFLDQFTQKGLIVQSEFMAKELSSSPTLFNRLLNFIVIGSGETEMTTHINFMLEMLKVMTVKDDNLISVLISFINQQIKGQHLYGVSELFVVLMVRFNLHEKAVFALFSDLCGDLENNNYKQQVIQAIVIASNRYPSLALKQETIVELLKEVSSLHDFSYKFDISPLLGVLINCEKTKARDIMIEKVVKICKLNTINLAKLIKNAVFNRSNRIILEKCMEIKPVLVNKYVVEFLNSSDYSDAEKDELTELLHRNNKLFYVESQGKTLNLVVALNSIFFSDFTVALDQLLKLMSSNKAAEQELMPLLTSCIELKLSSGLDDEFVKHLLAHVLFERAVNDHDLFTFIKNKLIKNELAFLSETSKTALTTILLKHIANFPFDLLLTVHLINTVETDIFSSSPFFSFLSGNKITDLATKIIKEFGHNVHDEFFKKLTKLQALPFMNEHDLCTLAVTIMSNIRLNSDESLKLVDNFSLIVNQFPTLVISHDIFKNSLNPFNDLTICDKTKLVKITGILLQGDFSLFQYLATGYFSEFESEISTLLYSTGCKVLIETAQMSFQGVLLLLLSSSVQNLSALSDFLKEKQILFKGFDSFFVKRRNEICLDKGNKKELVNFVNFLAENKTNMLINRDFLMSEMPKVKFSQNFFKMLVESVLSEYLISSDDLRCLKIFESKTFEGLNFNLVDQHLVQRAIDRISSKNLNLEEETIYVNTFETIFAIIANNKYNYKDIIGFVQKMLKVLFSPLLGKYTNLTDMLISFLLDNKKELDNETVIDVYRAASQNDLSLERLSLLSFDKNNFIAYYETKLTENDSIANNFALVIQNSTISKGVKATITSLLNCCCQLASTGQSKSLNLILAKTLNIIEGVKVPVEDVFQVAENVLNCLEKGYESDSIVNVTHSIEIVLDIATRLNCPNDKYCQMTETILKGLSKLKVEKSLKTRLNSSILSRFLQFVADRFDHLLVVQMIKFTFTYIKQDSAVLGDMSKAILTTITRDNYHLFYYQLLIFSGTIDDCLVLDMQLNEPNNIYNIFDCLPKILDIVRIGDSINEHEIKVVLFGLNKVMIKFALLNKNATSHISDHLVTITGAVSSLRLLITGENVDELDELYAAVFQYYISKAEVANVWEKVLSLDEHAQKLFFERFLNNIEGIQLQDSAKKQLCISILEKPVTDNSQCVKLTLVALLISEKMILELSDQAFRSLINISDYVTQYHALVCIIRIFSFNSCDHLELFDDLIERLVYFADRHYTQQLLEELNNLTKKASSELAGSLTLLVPFLARHQIKHENCLDSILNLAKNTVCSEFVDVIQNCISDCAEDQAITLIRALSVSFRTTLDSTQIEALSNRIVYLLIVIAKKFFIFNGHGYFSDCIAAFVLKMNAKQLKAALKEITKKTFKETDNETFKYNFEDFSAGIRVLQSFSKAAKKYFLANFNLVAAPLSTAIQQLNAIYCYKNQTKGKKPRYFKEKDFVNHNYLLLLKEVYLLLETSFNNANNNDSLSVEFFEEFCDRLFESVT